MSAITRRHGTLTDRIAEIAPTMPTDGGDPRRVAFNAALELAKAWYPKWRDPLKNHLRLGEADAELDEIEGLILKAERAE